MPTLHGFTTREEREEEKRRAAEIARQFEEESRLRKQAEIQKRDELSPIIEWLMREYAISLGAEKFAEDLQIIRGEVANPYSKEEGVEPMAGWYYSLRTSDPLVKSLETLVLAFYHDQMIIYQIGHSFYESFRTEEKKLAEIVRDATQINTALFYKRVHRFEVAAFFRAEPPQSETIVNPGSEKDTVLGRFMRGLRGRNKGV